MVDIETFRQTALSFAGATEQPHFDKVSFRANKKIFATLDVKSHRGCIKLSEVDQSVFSAFDKTIIFPVANKWGKQGWTNIDLSKVPESLFTDALTTAYDHCIKKSK